MSKIMLAIATLLVLFLPIESYYFYNAVPPPPPAFKGYYASASSTLQIFMEVEKNVGVPVIEYNSEKARVLLKSWDSKKCMSLADNGTVGSAECDGNDKNQLLELYHTGDNGGVVILSNNGRCLGALADDGRYVITNTKPNWCGNAGHYWRLTWHDSHFFLLNGESNKCLSKSLYTGKCTLDRFYHWAICNPKNPEKCWYGQTTLTSG